MSLYTKINYALNFLVLGMVIYHGLNGDTGPAIAGIAVYIIGSELDNLKYEIKA